MKSNIKVWTKQHKNILNDLNETNRYIVKREYIEGKMEEHSSIYLNAYSWLYNKCLSKVHIPIDAKYPIWLSLTEESKIDNSEGNVLLEISINKSDLLVLDLEKWGLIVNYMYIPLDEDDEKKHEKLLNSYNIDDPTAYMSSFYPNIKSKIIKSWDRLFDDNIMLGKNSVGIIWEIKKEWILKVTK